MKQQVKKNAINLAIAVVLLLILLSAGFSFYNRQVMEKAMVVQAQTDRIKQETENAFLNIRHMDISSRGYALMLEDRFLFYSVRDARKANVRNFHVLDSLFAAQGYSDPENYTALKKSFDTYTDIYEKMVQHLQARDVEAYKALLTEDYGKQFWTIFDRFTNILYTHQHQLNQQAQQQYQAAVFRNTLVQVLLLLIGLPTLCMMVLRMRKDAATRKALLLSLEANNRKYLFDGGRQGHKEAHDILEGSIENLKKAAGFVTQISEGNFDVQWEGLGEHNSPLNQENLAGRLLLMRDQMQRVKQEDEKRRWATEGLAAFSDVVRRHQQDVEALCHESLKFLVRYLRAQQGSLFVLREEESQEPYLQLAACYAFDRRKWVEKRLAPGQGLVGQTFLEGEGVRLSVLPPGYTHITSGLGDATPGCLVIVPLKSNEQVRAVLELAAFQMLEEHQFAFLEKAGEVIAAAVATAEINEKTSLLLRQLQDQTEQMRAQEEELRQNMEELEATQEEMRRKEVLLQQQLAALESTGKKG
jgi:CHASE3 domain sensor protein